MGKVLVEDKVDCSKIQSGDVNQTHVIVSPIPYFKCVDYTL